MINRRAVGAIAERVSKRPISVFAPNFPCVGVCVAAARPVVGPNSIGGRAVMRCHVSPVAASIPPNERVPRRRPERLQECPSEVPSLLPISSTFASPLADTEQFSGGPCSRPCTPRHLGGYRHVCSKGRSKRIIVPEKIIKIINTDCYGDSGELGIKRSTP